MNVARVRVKPDTLDEENRKFVQMPLRQPLFLNSVPKSGSHLLRNIVRMFVPVQSQYNADFIQHPFLDRHASAFDPRRNMLSWGHLLFNDKAAVATARVRRIALVRDPHDWTIARARFFLSDAFAGGVETLKTPGLTVEAILNMMIFGLPERAMPLATTFIYMGVAWLGPGTTLIRYEELVRALKDLEGGEADAFFKTLLDACGIDRPDDWRERVRIGADPSQSGTARENLTGVDVQLPTELPEDQKRMIEIVAPGLRSLLGYT